MHIYWPQWGEARRKASMTMVLCLWATISRADPDDTEQFFRVVSDATTVITAISPDGWLKWSNGALGSTCTIERATDLLGSNGWHSYVQHMATSSVMHVRCFDPNHLSKFLLPHHNIRYRR